MCARGQCVSPLLPSHLEEDGKKGFSMQIPYDWAVDCTSKFPTVGIKNEDLDDTRTVAFALILRESSLKRNGACDTPKVFFSFHAPTKINAGDVLDDTK